MRAWWRRPRKRRRPECSFWHSRFDCITASRIMVIIANYNLLFRPLGATFFHINGHSGAFDKLCAVCWMHTRLQFNWSSIGRHFICFLFFFTCVFFFYWSDSLCSRFFFASPHRLVNGPLRFYTGKSKRSITILNQNQLVCSHCVRATFRLFGHSNRK